MVAKEQISLIEVQAFLSRPSKDCRFSTLLQSLVEQDLFSSTSPILHFLTNATVDARETIFSASHCCMEPLRKVAVY
jgi:hypothetical protein